MSDEPKEPDTNPEVVPVGGGLDELAILEAKEDAGIVCTVAHPVTKAVLGYFLASFIGTGEFNKRWNHLQDRWLAKNSKPRGAYHLIPQNEKDELANEAAVGTIALYFWGFRPTAGADFYPNRADGSYNEKPPMKARTDRFGNKIGDMVDMDQVHKGNMALIYRFRDVRRQVDAVALERDEFLANDQGAVAGN